jgi:DNA-binding NtrC family response regulator
MSEADDRPVLLVVDDDLGLQKRVRGTLDRYRVVCADSREAAIAQVRRHEPSVVALDLGLPPEADTPAEGLRALDEILAISPAIRVVALTAQGGSGAVRALGQGACDCLPKPFEPEGLGPAIDRAFRLVGLDGNDFVRVDPRYFRPAEVDLLIGDATKAREKLGWTPTCSFDELVRVMVAEDLRLEGLDPDAVLR